VIARLSLVILALSGAAFLRSRIVLPEAPPSSASPEEAIRGLLRRGAEGDSLRLALAQVSERSSGARSSVVPVPAARVAESSSSLDLTGLPSEVVDALKGERPDPVTFSDKLMAHLTSLAPEDVSARQRALEVVAAWPEATPEFRVRAGLRGLEVPTTAQPTVQELETLALAASIVAANVSTLSERTLLLAQIEGLHPSEAAHQALERAFFE